MIKADRGGISTDLLDVSGTIYSLGPLHGGRDVRFYAGGPATLMAHFDGTSWGVIGDNADTVLSGFERSRYALSHNGDSLAYTNWTNSQYWVGEHAPVRVYVKKVAATGTPPVLIELSDPLPAPVAAPECVYRRRADGACFLAQDPSVLHPTSYGQWQYYPTVAYSPVGDSIFVSVPSVQATYSYDDWHPCYQVDQGWDCRNITVGRTVVVDTIWAINIVTRGKRVKGVVAGATAGVTGISEGGLQMAYNSSTWSHTFTLEPAGWFYSGYSESNGPCLLTYTATQGSPEQTLALGSQCYVPTIAPIREARINSAR